ncbi:MAG: preQ(1) synthase [Deltaproteobacteria bacterium]|nr:preQ(1) synthase [Deltaproteobacteria bacterium]
MPTQPSKELQTIPNPRQDRDYEVAMECPEFTCVCPKTGQPDFATIRIRYVPGPRCVELLSLKLYLWSYRGEGAFHEDVVNRILDDLVAACAPKYMSVEGEFNVRGGIHTLVTAEHGARPRGAGRTPATG